MNNTATIKVNIFKERIFTMKKALPVFFAVMCVCLCMTSFASSLSPAIGILSERLEMKRCITTNEVLSFNEESFDEYFGKNTKSIIVASLPDASQGVLYCGGFEVKEGQTLTRDSFSFVTFAPNDDFLGTSDFLISNEKKLLCCNVNVSAVQNKPPVTGKQMVETQKNISVFKTFSAADPENDSLVYEIVKYPRYGKISINDSDGMFVYSPKSDFMGKDSFSYRAVDTFGNTSDTQKVEIRVSKPSCNAYFSDMENHWAHNSAVKMASTGLMTGEKQGDETFFYPEKDMTRGDFLALSLITAGLEKDVPYVDKTAFSDDEAIPSNIKSYAQYAYDKGIVSGYDDGNGGVCFDSESAVTRAQAAVIVSKILGFEENNVKAEEKLYTDAAAIPSWAMGSISTLTACGIINGVPSGEISPEKVLTRAEGAEIICNVSDYIEDKKQEENKKKKTIFNLFGLLG